MNYRDIKILLNSDSLYASVLRLSLEVKRFKKVFKQFIMTKLDNDFLQ